MLISYSIVILLLTCSNLLLNRINTTQTSSRDRKSLPSKMMESEWLQPVLELFDLLPQEHSPVDEKCPICLEIYGTTISQGSTAEDAVRLRTCSHVVGRECIKQWIKSEDFAKECPLCRADIYEVMKIDNDPLKVADEALMRIAAREPSWTFSDLRAYWRRCLEPNPPTMEAKVEDWWHSGRRFNSYPGIFGYRSRMSRIMRIWSYYRCCEDEEQLPPLHPSANPTLEWTTETMDDRHHDTFLAFLENSDAFSHRFWYITMRGASSREIYNLLCYETYIFGSFGVLPFAASDLGGWTGFLNDGRNRVRSDPNGPDRTWNRILEEIAIEEGDAGVQPQRRQREGLFGGLWKRIFGTSV